MTVIPKRTKDTNIANEVAQGKLLRQKIIKLADEASDRFMAGGNLNDILAEIANRENFNRLQIQRLVEESNTVAYNKQYDTLRKDNDRRITFELAELNKIVAAMGASAPPEVENPNLVRGEEGEGKLNKTASVEIKPLFNANANIDSRRSQLMEKKAAAEGQTKMAHWEKLQRSIRSNIFKIANSLVATEKLTKKANVVFNTLLDDITFDHDTIEGIQKKASEIAINLVDTRRANTKFAIDLQVNGTEKIASLVLGEHSFLKTAADLTTLTIPKVSPTVDVSSYQQLVALGKQLVAEQNEAQQLQNQSGV